MFRASFLALAAAACVNAVELTRGVDVIPGRYLFELRANITDDEHAAFALRLGMKQHKIGSTFRALSGALSDAELLWALQQEHIVISAEEDQVVRASQSSCPSNQGSPVSWGQVRTTNRGGSSNVYRYNSNWGNGVDSYVLDTGIRCTHSEFRTNRCIWGANFAGGGNNDVNGHGTHCAGTVGGNIYGIAKATTLIAVKVLTDSGSGSTSGVVSVVEWAARQRHTRGRPGVINMSLGGGASAAMDNAVNAAVSDGTHCAVASGNSNANACNSSPARASGPVTVSSTELASNSDRKSSFSNWGNCVDIWAPGSSITSAAVSSDNAFATYSGTSMACPHVAGVLAMHLTSSPNMSPSQGKSTLTNSAARNVISGITDSGSPNLLLQINC